MKTRIKLHLIIYIAFAGLFMACENEIPYNPGQQNPQLIMNALLNAGQTENLVYLHLSEGNSIGRINEATLSLYVNDKQVESPQAISPEEYYGNMQNQLDKGQYEALLKVCASKYSVSLRAYNPEITFAWKPQRKAESIMSVRK